MEAYLMACITNEMTAVMERFEKAVREKVLLTETDQFYGLPGEQLVAISEYNDAKAELTECLSWVP